MDATNPLRLQFDDFELDGGEARLLRAGRAVELAPKAFSVLCALARQPGKWVGERCDTLVCDQHWLHPVAVARLPDGSFDASYTFRHAVYRHVFYQRIGALTRAQLHGRIAVSMERSRAKGVAITAAELASHFELSHELMTALRHYAEAAEGCGRAGSPAATARAAGCAS